MKPEDPRQWRQLVASAALVVAAASTTAAWAYTVRELNAITAYQPAGAAALRRTLAANDVAYSKAARGSRLSMRRASARRDASSLEAHAEFPHEPRIAVEIRPQESR